MLLLMWFLLGCSSLEPTNVGFRDGQGVDAKCHDAPIIILIVVLT